MREAKGHRKKLRERFLRAGIKALNDYEIVELLLTIATPQQDCKQAAKRAIKKYKTLRGVLDASPDELQEIKGIGPSNIFGLKFAKEVADEYLKGRIVKRPIAKSSKEVFDYLRHSMSRLKREVFKVIYLNNANRIVGVENLFRGTIDRTTAYSREVIKSALKNNATRLMFAHNHPAGNLDPSERDIKITRRLSRACREVGLEVVDHIIIAGDKYCSLRSKGLM